MRVGCLLLLGLLGCSPRHRAELIDPNAPVRVVMSSAHGPVAVTVEVVDIPETVNRGMMHRGYLAPDHGMLFFMGKDRDWTFWMHNTLIPLDMVFISRDLTVVGIVHDARPLTEDRKRVGAASLYVLEVNGGWANRHRVSVGAKVQFENLRL